MIHLIDALSSKYKILQSPPLQVIKTEIYSQTKGYSRLEIHLSSQITRYPSGLIRLTNFLKTSLTASCTMKLNSAQNEPLGTTPSMEGLNKFKFFLKKSIVKREHGLNI